MTLQVLERVLGALPKAPDLEEVRARMDVADPFAMVALQARALFLGGAMRAAAGVGEEALLAWVVGHACRLRAHAVQSSPALAGVRKAACAAGSGQS